MVKIVQSQDLNPDLTIVEETVLDPETDREIVFRANSQDGIDELAEAYWGPATGDGAPGA